MKWINPSDPDEEFDFQLVDAINLVFTADQPIGILELREDIVATIKGLETAKSFLVASAFRPLNTAERQLLVNTLADVIKIAISHKAYLIVSDAGQFWLRSQITNHLVMF